METAPTILRRLYLMQVATLPETNIPMVCYLVQTDTGTNILIDSGLPANVQPPPGRPTPIMGEDVITQLAALDLQPRDINLLVCTHFDLDHAGRHEAFATAELIVQRRHYELARGGYERFVASRPHWDHPDLRYRLIDGDTTLVPGFELIETSGHVPGHQSALLRLPDTGPVLLTIDAVPNEQSFSPDRPAGGMNDDEDAVRASTRKLLDLVERERAPLVIFGHDAQQWATLRKLPSYYS